MSAVDSARAVLDAHARQTRETGPVHLSDAYLRAVDRVEALPDNCSGSDKTWVIRLVQEATRV